MNNARRKVISTVIDILGGLQEQIEEILDKEQEAFDNMPESLEGTDRYDAMEEAVDNLDSAVEYFEELIDALECAKE